MEGYITYSQLGLLIMFMIVAAVGGYAILTMRNVNAAVKYIGIIQKENQEALGRAIPNIAIASENVAEITHDLRAGFSETSKAMEPPTRSPPMPWLSARRPKPSPVSLRQPKKFKLATAVPPQTPFLSGLWAGELAGCLLPATRPFITPPPPYREGTS